MIHLSRRQKLLASRIYAMVLLLCCVGLYLTIKTLHGGADQVQSAIGPAIFFVLCLQAATYMLWSFRKSGKEKIYDSPTSILALGSGVVFYELGSTTVAFICYALSCIVLAEIDNQRYVEHLIKILMGTISMASTILVFVLLDFDIRAPMQVFVTQIAFAAIVAGLVNKTMLQFNDKLTFIPVPKNDDQLVDAFLKLIPLAVFSGLIANYYFTFGKSMLWAFAIPVLMYYLLASSSIEIEQAKTVALKTLILSLEAKDPYTAKHADRVATFAELTGRELGISRSKLKRLNHAALLHDIGKLIIPNDILNKPSTLTKEEYAIVLRHDIVTTEILNRIDFLKSTAKFAGINYNSVEYMSNKYLEPHIIAACDAFDAMTSSRAYRKALTQETAFAELRKNIGSQFREDVVEALIKVVETSNAHYGLGYETDLVHQNAPLGEVGSAGLTHAKSILFQKRLQTQRSRVESKNPTVVTQVTKSNNK